MSGGSLDDQNIAALRGLRTMRVRKAQPHHGRGGSQHIGRLRIAAAKLLTEKTHLDVSPDEIQPLTGGARTLVASNDLFAWEVFTQTKDGLVFVGYSWQTLTEFVSLAKRGNITISNRSEIEAGE